MAKTIKQLNEEMDKYNEPDIIRGQEIDVYLGGNETKYANILNILNQAVSKTVGKFTYVATIQDIDIYFIRAGHFGDPFWAGVKDGQPVKIGPTKLAKLLTQI